MPGVSDSDLIDAAVCMANRSDTGSGWIFVGVKNDGTVDGAELKSGSQNADKLRVQSLIANRTVPPLSVTAEFVKIRDALVLAIEVPVSTRPVGNSSGRYTRRVIGGDGKPACVPFHFHEMQSQSVDRGNLDYTAIPIANMGIGSLDPLEIDRYRRAIVSSQGRGDNVLLHLNNQELLRALGAIEEEDGEIKVRVLGLLLFGYSEAIAEALPTHEIAFQVLDGTNVLVNEFWRTPLLRALEDLLAQFRARHREHELFVGATRLGVPEFPEPVIRESIANALIHRDYSRVGAVHVQLRDDRIVVSNPGGFPPGVHVGNLLATPPVARNPLIADAFKRGGYVERTSRGINLIHYEQLRTGHPKPSYGRSTNELVSLDLFGGSPDAGFAQYVATMTQAGRVLNTHELIILDYFRREPTLSPEHAALAIHGNVEEAHELLNNLTVGGVLQSTSTFRRHQYRLTQRVHDALATGTYFGASNARFDVIAQNVIAFLGQNETITRRQVSQLCSIDNAKAYRTLRKLVDDGLIMRVGTRGRNVRYRLRPHQGQLELFN